jgi:hypothetical protein
MAAANGTLTPPEPEPLPEPSERTPNKRKREDEDQVTQQGRDEVSLRSVDTQKDMLEILQQYGERFIEETESADIVQT